MHKRKPFEAKKNPSLSETVWERELSLLVSWRPQHRKFATNFFFFPEPFEKSLVGRSKSTPATNEHTRTHTLTATYTLLLFSGMASSVMPVVPGEPPSPRARAVLLSCGILRHECAQQLTIVLEACLRQVLTKEAARVRADSNTSSTASWKRAWLERMESTASWDAPFIRRRVADVIIHFPRASRMYYLTLAAYEAELSDSEGGTRPAPPDVMAERAPAFDAFLRHFLTSAARTATVRTFSFFTDSLAATLGVHQAMRAALEHVASHLPPLRSESQGAARSRVSSEARRTPQLSAHTTMTASSSSAPSRRYRAARSMVSMRSRRGEGDTGGEFHMSRVLAAANLSGAQRSRASQVETAQRTMGDRIEEEEESYEGGDHEDASVSQSKGSGTYTDGKGTPTSEEDAERGPSEALCAKRQFSSDSKACSEATQESARSFYSRLTENTESVSQFYAVKDMLMAKHARPRSRNA